MNWKCLGKSVLVVLGGVAVLALILAIFLAPMVWICDRYGEGWCGAWPIILILLLFTLASYAECVEDCKPKEPHKKKDRYKNANQKKLSPKTKARPGASQKRSVR